ncbi:DUF2723 domain-containing protein [Roseibium salinum]|nr:DUF2723 domain-containing protein [Roseibium salinum]
MNSGDSAKFQILGHTQILLHGPGYPFVQLLGALVRFMDLPLPPWQTMTVVMAVIPASIANAVAFLFVRHLTKNTIAAIAAALLLGSAELMAVQATEAEVYPLALAFILTTLFLLALFVETRKLGYFSGRLRGLFAVLRQPSDDDHAGAAVCLRHRAEFPAHRAAPQRGHRRGLRSARRITVSLSGSRRLQPGHRLFGIHAPAPRSRWNWSTMSGAPISPTFTGPD